MKKVKEVKDSLDDNTKILNLGEELDKARKYMDKYTKAKNFNSSRQDAYAENMAFYQGNQHLLKKYKNDIKNKKKFEHLSKCLGEATNGKYYFDHLKQAMTNDMHKEKVPAGSVEKMLTENGWLYQGERTTEGNIDFKKIKKLLNSKK